MTSSASRREQRITAADQVDAGGDHRGGVDEGADRRWAFHRVGQPDLQRELRRLADAAEEDAEAGGDQHPVRHRAVFGSLRRGRTRRRGRRDRPDAVIVFGMTAREQHDLRAVARRTQRSDSRRGIVCRGIEIAADDAAGQLQRLPCVSVSGERIWWKISSKLNVPTWSTGSAGRG